MQRSGNVAAAPNKLSSSVSENINRFKDDMCGRSLVNPDYDDRPVRKVSASYEPKGVPDPFRTATRGIIEELSRTLLKHIRPRAIKLTGLCYNLEGYHPDLLFIAAVDLPKEQVAKLCAERPGKDFREGELRFTPATFDDEDMFTKHLHRRLREFWPQPSGTW